MRIHNPTDRVVTTWKGHELQPGATEDIDLGAAEADWLLRHGCTRPRKPRPAQVEDGEEAPVLRTSKKRTRRKTK